MQQHQNDLTLKQEKTALIASLTATGDLKKLTIALNEGLDSNLTINEIKEILIQIYAYAGFPRSLNAINLFMTVLSDRKNKGIKDNQGCEASPIEQKTDKYAQGKNIRNIIRLFRFRKSCRIRSFCS